MRKRSPQPKAILIPDDNRLNNRIENLLYIGLLGELLNPGLNLSPLVKLGLLDWNVLGESHRLRGRIRWLHSLNQKRIAEFDQRLVGLCHYYYKNDQILIFKML